MHEREKSVGFFDIDKTAYEGFLLFPLVDAQARDGFVEREGHAQIQMTLNDYESGVLTYNQMVKQVLEQYAFSLKGRRADDAVEITRKFLTGEGNKFYPYVEQVIGQLKGTHDIFFVTAEPQFAAEATRDIYKADGAISTVFTTEGGIFTGLIDNALSTGNHKAEAIVDLLKNHNMGNSFAFGDSEGDIQMLDAVENAVCVNPSPELEAVAYEKQWFVTYTPESIPLFVRSRIGRF